MRLEFLGFMVWFSIRVSGLRLTLPLLRVINVNFLFQSFTRDLSYIFFLSGWENLHCELGIEEVKDQVGPSDQLDPRILC